MLRRDHPDPGYLQSGSTRLMDDVHPASHRPPGINDWLGRHMLAVVGGLLSLSWCVHLYLLLAAARRGDIGYRNFEFVVVVGHELFVAALVAWAKLRPRRRR